MRVLAIAAEKDVKIGALTAGVRDVEQANANCQRRIVDTERERDEARAAIARLLDVDEKCSAAYAPLLPDHLRKLLRSVVKP